MGVGWKKTSVHTQKSAGARRKRRERPEDWVWDGRKPLSTPKKPPVEREPAMKGRKIGCRGKKMKLPHPKTLWLKEN